MKIHIIILMILLPGLSCIGQEENEEIIGITIKYHSPLCNDYCRLQFTANRQNKVMIKTPGISITRETDRMLIRERSSVSNVDWEKLLASFSLIEIKALPDVYGCPGCNDGPIGILIVVSKNGTYKKIFEGDAPPATIEKLSYLMNNGLFKNK